jgi:hypothetical protein
MCDPVAAEVDSSASLVLFVLRLPSQVHKAEGPAPDAECSSTAQHMRGAHTRAPGRTLKTSPPAQQQQQGPGQGLRRVSTDGSADSVPFQRQQDLLEALGEAARQHLTTMRARIWGARLGGSRGGSALQRVSRGEAVLAADGPAAGGDYSGGEEVGVRNATNTTASTVSSYGMQDGSDAGGGTTVSLPKPGGVQGGGKAEVDLTLLYL